MISLKTLSIRNFLSYGNNTTVFQLDQPGTTLILGEDLDNTADGTGSNGVGKTTMLQAIVYALYDKIISDDYTLDGLVNNINDEQMEVSLEFIASNGVTYKVIRQRKMKKHGPEKN
jgi:DNA repair exonuclease SbcCD ATPase subunit